MITQSPAAPAGTLLYLPYTQLRLHPSNIRRFYEDQDVQAMAASIQGCGGVLQALQVIRGADLAQTDRALLSDFSEELYYVVDGNLRLTAARTLGTACPRLKCELIAAERSEQLLLMATTSEMTFPKDPVSLALHYRRLRDEEHLTVRAIARRVGCSEARINTYLGLLELEPEIQKLVSQGELPRDAKVQSALLTIPNSQARVQMAKRLAQSGASIKKVVESCATLAQRLEAQEAQRRSRVPALLHAVPQVARIPQGHQNTPWPALREATAETCQRCDIQQQSIPHIAEPAWVLVVESSQETCEACTVREVMDACNVCPQVELLRRLMKKLTPVTGQGGAR